MYTADRGTMAEKKKKGTAQGLLLVLILLTGCLARLLFLGENPAGLHQDEAYSAYNAWAMMEYGTDSYGYVRPVYYTVWGSGMSVLYSWLEMPFLALLGTTATAVRLPQALFGCLSILAAYGLGKEMGSVHTGLFFAGLLAVNPWHIQQSRFGLDAGLAVPMFLFFIYFLCRYLNGKRGSVWGVAVFGGLTLYCYALTWLLVPGVLFLSLLFFRKRVSFDKKLLGAGLLLFVMAFPLLLFLAVNFGWLPEIRNGLFSVPKLPALRTGEMAFSLSALKKRFLWLVSMLWTQHDDMWWISNENVGSYYYISTPFIVIGFLWQLKIFAAWLGRKEELPLSFLITIWFGTAFAIGCCIDMAKFHKVNFIHIPIIFYGALGLMCVLRFLERLGRRWAWAGTGAAALGYLASFGFYVYSQASFGHPYEAYGNSVLSHMHWYRYEAAMDRAEELTEGEIGILGLNYANVMLYRKISPGEYLETVTYSGDDPAFQTVAAVGRYHFDEMPGEGAESTVFVYPYMMEPAFQEAGYRTEHVTECYGVAYRE